MVTESMRKTRKMTTLREVHTKMPDKELSAVMMSKSTILQLELLLLYSPKISRLALLMVPRYGVILGRLSISSLKIVPLLKYLPLLTRSSTLKM